MFSVFIIICLYSFLNNPLIVCGIIQKNSLSIHRYCIVINQSASNLLNIFFISYFESIHFIIINFTNNRIGWFKTILFFPLISTFQVLLQNSFGVHHRGRWQIIFPTLYAYTKNNYYNNSNADQQIFFRHFCLLSLLLTITENSITFFYYKFLKIEHWLNECFHYWHMCMAYTYKYQFHQYFPLHHKKYFV